ncbi:PilZ domain-containing protein [Pseudomonas sp. RIT-PI-S]|uniref:PilZ domain-containing protein n=1 Tax=Pseudomonas sp. RIT-PI-S TaxID=3035295 RepID=UPI0021D9D3E1|nr:PilZ domain-containing protein [Pseudomonas sp. RIT-PI-S]
MPTSDDAERREYYRIEDRIALEITPLDDSLEAPSEGSPLFNLLSELHLSEFESQHLLRQLGDANRALSGFLKAQNKRIDLLSQVLAQMLLGSLGDPRPVVMSEAGLDFHNPSPFAPGTRLDMKMAFMPQALGMMLRARVVHCNTLAEGGYAIGVEFEGSTDAQRQLLARYVLQKQAMERRQARDQALDAV